MENLFSPLHNVYMVIAAFIVVAIIVSIFFAYRVRKNNFDAVAHRTEELNKQGITNIYLVQLRLPRTDQSRTWRITLWGTPASYGDADLMYVRGGELIYESPWWNKATEIQKYKQNDTIVELGESKQLVNIFSRLRRGKMPGIVINKALFFVLGNNITDPNTAKQATHYQSWVFGKLEANRQKMLEELKKAGFSVVTSLI